MGRLRWMTVNLVLLLGLVGCLVSSDGGDMHVETISCEQIDSNTRGVLTCVTTEDGVLLQTPSGTQLTVTTPDIELTFDATVYWGTAAGQMQVATLDGVSVLRADNTTRIIPAGTSATLVLIGDSLRVNGPPSQPSLTDSTLIASLPTDQLTRAVDPGAMVFSAPAAPPATNAPAPTVAANPPGGPTAPVQPTSAAPNGILPTDAADAAPRDAGILAEDGTCTPPDGWDARYTVQRGDNLTRIGLEYDVDVDALMAANCLDNPDRITAGEALFVPGEAAAPGADAAAAGPDAAFAAERDVILVGDCVTLTWNVADARAVTLDGDPVAQAGELAVCPLATTTYSLLVTFNNGLQTGYTVTITVTE